MLKIHKKFLEKAEQYGRWGYMNSFNPYAVRYIFVLPDDSKYPGYAYFRDTSDRKYDGNNNLIMDSIGAEYELRGNYYCFDTEEGETFRLVKYKGREEGKSYKRYNLTSEEMYAAFNYGNVEIEKLDVVCAELKEYLNNGTRRSGAVISENFTVGHSDGTWLYLKTEKRRIKSNGVRIIGTVAEGKEQELRDFITSHYDSVSAADKNAGDLRGELEKLESIERQARKLLSCVLSESIVNICQVEIEALNKEISDILLKKELSTEDFEKLIKEKFLINQ